MANSNFNDGTKASIKLWEIILISMVSFILPAIFLMASVARNDFHVQNVAVIMLTNVALILVIFMLMLADITIKRSYLPLFFGCHQNACRSFRLFNKTLSLCARCTGIALGIVLALFITSTNVSWWWFLLMMIPLIIDGSLQQLTAYQSNNIKRFISGMLFAPGFITVYAGFHYVLITLALRVLGHH